MADRYGDGRMVYFTLGLGVNGYTDRARRRLACPQPLALSTTGFSELLQEWKG